MTRPILVTGAGGRVGSALRNLIGGSVHRWERHEDGDPQSAPVLYMDQSDLDIGDAYSVMLAVGRTKPSAIVNLAACTLPNAEAGPDGRSDAMRVNAIALHKLGLIAQAAFCPVVHISTDCVFSGTNKLPYAETAEPHPSNWYGESKLEGERHLAAALLSHIIIRTTGVFLAGRPNFAETVLHRASKGEPLEIVSDTTFTPTHATELARAILIATERLIEDHSISGTYHFAGPECLSYLDFAEMILAEAELDTPIKAATQAEREAIEGFKRPKNACLDSTKFTQTFGYTHRPLRDCVRDVVRAAMVSA